MYQCPHCGGSAEADPEHSGMMRCMSCWHVWMTTEKRPCPGKRNLLAPGLQMLEECRELNR